MSNKHLKIEMKSYKELVDINQKKLIKNIIICISCSYLCVAFCSLFVSSVLKSNSFLTILPISLFSICFIYVFKSYNTLIASNRNIKIYKNKLKSLNNII